MTTAEPAAAPDDLPAQIGSATLVSFTDAILLQVSDEWLKGASAGCRSTFEHAFMRQLAQRLIDANVRLVRG